MNDSHPAQHNCTGRHRGYANTSEHNTALGSKEGSAGAARQPDGTLSKGAGSCSTRDKKQMFHKSSLSRFIK